MASKPKGTDLFWETTDDDFSTFEAWTPVQDQTVASLWHQQVNAHDSAPQHYPVRRRIKFSPSGATKCLRELFYANTNAEQDTASVSPWKKRMARNGTAFHEGIQGEFTDMVKRLQDAGKLVNFEVVEWELVGNKVITVTLDGETFEVELDGRCDGMLKYVGESIPGLIENGDLVLLEFKSKDKLTNLKKVAKMGAQDDHKAQVVCYSLIWGINRALIHYESLQKPKWSAPDNEIDMYVEAYTVSEMEQRAVLRRLATCVRHIKKDTLPPAETNKCSFCPFKGRCAKDGGYRG